MAFHHGTKTTRVAGGSVAVETVDGAIIGIVGTAPIGAVNELTVCQTIKDFAQFGVILNQASRCQTLLTYWHAMPQVRCMWSMC